MLNIDQIESLGIAALQKTLKVHEALGDLGEQKVRKNQFGETALKIDLECEKAIIDFFQQENFPVRIISEEHGIVEITKEPRYLAVLDGLDGTKEYQLNRGKGRYGTMLGIFSNLDPIYDDYLFGGIMEHPKKRLVFVSKSNGSFVLSNGKKKKISCSKTNTLTKKTKIYADLEYDKNRGITFIEDNFISKLKDNEILYQCSTAVHYVDLVLGKVDAILECTRKKNLEMAAAYGIVREAGGVMMISSGINFGNQKYLKLGQKKHLPMVATCTHKLAQEIIKKLN